MKLIQKLTFVFFFLLLAPAANAQSALLEDFSSLRKSGDGTDLWFAYLGEDPGQTYSLSNGTLKVVGALANCGGRDCGVYMDFLPRNGGYPFPSAYVQSYLRSGTWSANFNRLRFKFKCSKNEARRSDGGDILQIGTYVRGHSVTDAAWQGAHYYHLLDPNVYADRWMQVELNRVPQHQVGQDPYTNWPEDPEWQNQGVHYFDGLTIFYFDTQGDWTGQTCSFADYRFDIETGEPDSYVSSIAATYSGSFYEVSWAGPKNQAVTYDVRYSTTSMKGANFDATGTNGGSVQNSGDGYVGVIWRSPNMGEQPNGLYVAIRPHNLTAFSEIYIPNFTGSSDTSPPAVPRNLRIQ